MFLSLRKHVRHWSNPLGRCFFQSERDDRTTPVWRAPEGTITAPVDGGGAWPDNTQTPRPIGGRHEACGTWPRCRWAAAGPGRASSRRAELPISDPGPTGVEGAGGSGGHGRASRRGAERSEVATRPAVPGRLRGDAPDRTSATQAPLVWRVPEGPAAVPVGGGGAWPGFEATRRAKLAARTARGRAAAHRHTQRPGPPARGTPAAPQAPPEHAQKETPTAPGTP